MDVSQTFTLALERHRAKQYAEAEKLYLSILKNSSNHSPTLHNLGILYYSTGHLNNALDLLSKAVSVNPSEVQYWIQYIEILIKSGEHRKAKEILKQAQERAQNSSKLKFLELRLQELLSNEGNIATPNRDLKNRQALAAELLRLYRASDFQGVIALCKNISENEKTIDVLNIEGASYAALKNFETAEHSFRAIIETHPGSPDAHNNLGVCLKDQRKFDLAIICFKKAIAIKPEYAEAFYNMGLVMKEVGDDEQAIANYTEATRLKPDYFQAFNNLGVVYMRQGHHTLAIANYNHALKINPNYYEALGNLSVSLNALDRVEEAKKTCYAAIKINSKYTSAYINLGKYELRTSNLKQALSVFQRALQIEPESPNISFEIGNALASEHYYKQSISFYQQSIKHTKNFFAAHFNLALAYSELNDHDNAIIQYKKALLIDEQSFEALNNLGNVYKDIYLWDHASSCYEQALAIKPDYTDAINNLAVLSQDLCDSDKAIALFEKVVALNVRSLRARRNLAVALSDAGRKEDALREYRAALNIDHMDTETYRFFSSAYTFVRNDKHLTRLKELFNNASSIQDKWQSAFALSKAFDDLDLHRESFEYLKIGNDLRKSYLNYDFKLDKKIFERANDLLTSIQNINVPNLYLKQVPIFIVGMMRSGTSLIEQIISSHSSVFGAGELNFAVHHAKQFFENSDHDVQMLLTQFRLNYLNALSFYNRDERFITDKLPQNFLLIGIIMNSIPEAKIVHVRRNSKATCWSNYKNYFSSNAHGFTHCLDDIVSYYHAYDNFMHSANRTYGERIINVDYDELVETPSNWIPKLIGELNLEMEERCLRPERNMRAVRTTSQHQIRNKIYTGSSKNWETYAEFINGKFTTLP